MLHIIHESILFLNHLYIENEHDFCNTLMLNFMTLALWSRINFLVDDDVNSTLKSAQNVMLRLIWSSSIATRYSNLLSCGLYCKVWITRASYRDLLKYIYKTTTLQIKMDDLKTHICKTRGETRRHNLLKGLWSSGRYL